MMALYEFRARLTRLYQRYDFLIRYLLKFCLLLGSFLMIRNSFSGNGTLSKTVVVLPASAFCSFLPFSLILLVMMVYLVLEIFSISSLMAATVLIFCLILYCFLLRFTPDSGAAVLAVPVLRGISLPYAVPLVLGAFGSLFSIIPVVSGIFLYYMLDVIRNNMSVTIDTLTGNTDEAYEIYMNVINQLVKNPAMYVTMLSFSAAILVVYFIRRMKMDYSFEISIAVGTAVILSVNLIGSLKYDMGFSVVGMLFGTLISGLLALIIQFFYRSLDYAATENVQFEDDDYYYYVRAVPKLRADAPAKPVKKIMTGKKEQASEDEEDEELFDEVMDAFDDEVKKEEELRRAEAFSSVRAKKPENRIADDGLFEDEEETEAIAPATAKPVAAKPAEGRPENRTSGAHTVVRGGQTLNVIYDDDDEDE